MNTLKATFCALVIAAIFAKDADAALMEVDAGFGAGSGTLDTASGLTWLDLTLSIGIRFEDMLVQTQSGGPFSGFRFASADEIEQLWINAGIPNIGLGFDSPQYASVVALQALIGVTLPGTGFDSNESIGFYDAGPSGGPPLRSYAHVLSNDLFQTGNTRLFTGGTFIPESRAVTFGSWLIQGTASEPIPTPTPGALALLALGLLGLGVRRRMA